MSTTRSNTSTPHFDVASESDVLAARKKLDAHAVEMMAWHFHESTGCPFWLNYAKSLNFDPLVDVKCFNDLKKFPPNI